MVKTACGSGWGWVKRPVGVGRISRVRVTAGESRIRQESLSEQKGLVGSIWERAELDKSACGTSRIG